MKLNKMKCNLCFWWDTEAHPVESQGECRGNPPQMVEEKDPSYLGFYYYVWPHTTGVDGCRNFKPKKGWEPTI
jgi:hypothetical protein